MCDACKENCRRTDRVKTDNKELLKLFLTECLKYGDVNMPIISDNKLKNLGYFAVTDKETPCGHNMDVKIVKKEPKPKHGVK